MALRLSSRPSVRALLLDVLVLTVAIPFMLDAHSALWLRVVAAIAAVVAAVLGVRSIMLLYRAP